MHTLVLSNTLTGKREPFVPLDPPQIRMYVCGITPYDRPHLGHGRVYVTFDILLRLLQFLGYSVTYCRNFTDIDDKLINKAQKKWGDPLRYREIAHEFIAAFHHDMQRLGCLKPTYEPRVTDNMPAIITFIEELITHGYAYQAGNDVYYAISRFAPYGKLSKRTLENLRAGARVQPEENKKDPLDFALWKGEPEGTFWHSPWGWGRPGWHIECSALARKYLGTQIDIHGGGMDLIFPHHENEIAQTEALTHTTFARFWLHNAFVQVNQEKMSKSLGNFFTLDDIFAKYDPVLIRFYFLNHHYRSPLEFSFDQLDELKKSYRRLCTLFENAPLHTDNTLLSKSSIVQKMHAHLLDDLNTVGMLAVVFEHSAVLQQNAHERSNVRTFLQLITGLPFELLAENTVTITPEIQTLLDERERARAIRDWKRADELREQLRAHGVDVQDKKLRSNA